MGRVLARSGTSFFSDDYEDLLYRLLSDSSSVVEGNSRTGRQVRVLIGGTGFTVDLGSNRIPVTGTRRLYPRTAAAEVAWFLSGHQDTGLLHSLGIKIWDKFLEVDGSVAGAYGYRWRRHFGRDQLLDAVETLRDNPSDRRCVVMAWDPSEDGLGRPSKNVPCPVGFSLTVTAGRLHSSLWIRSSDVFVGLPYDVMGHALLMDAVAMELGVGLGHMDVSLANAHLYEDHWDMAMTCLKAPAMAHHRGGPFMPRWSISAIVADPKVYAKTVKVEADKVAWPDYAPKPEVVA